MECGWMNVLIKRGIIKVRVIREEWGHLLRVQETKNECLNGLNCDKCGHGNGRCEV